MDRIIVPCGSCGQKNSIPADKQHLGPKCGRCGRPLDLQGRAAAVELDAGSFDRFIQSPRVPVLTFLYSTTCGYCTQMAPVIDRLASRYGGRLAVGRLDVNHNPVVAARFNLRGVPLLLLFRNAQVLQRFEGALPESQLIEVVERVV